MVHGEDCIHFAYRGVERIGIDYKIRMGWYMGKMMQELFQIKETNHRKDIGDNTGILFRLGRKFIFKLINFKNKLFEVGFHKFFPCKKSGS